MERLLEYKRPLINFIGGASLGFCIGYTIHEYLQNKNECKQILKDKYRNIRNACITEKEIKFDMDVNSNETLFHVWAVNKDYIKDTTTFVQDKCTHFATYWKPRCPSIGSVFLCHGYAEYMGHGKSCLH